MNNIQIGNSLAQTALEMIENNFVVGLGTGRAATAFIHVLGERVREGLHIHGVPTSDATAKLAADLGIPLVTLDNIEVIDVTLDGADEVDPQLDLIKGLGGALVREKIIAASSRRLVILVDAKKIVSNLGEHGVLPIEVVPFGLSFCRRRLAKLGYSATPRQVDGKPFISDNGNFVLDCRVPMIQNPTDLDQLLCAMPGVVGTGLFVGMANTVLIQYGKKVQVWQRQPTL
jgi:ribose 5-phosphate isomerase A